MKQILTDPRTQIVFDVFSADKDKFRVVGGAIRNHLMNMPIKDVDFATTLIPSEVIDAANRAGFRVLDVGIEHGTVHLVTKVGTIEITTTRKDIETFGRRARVEFGASWEEDANRRDFTVNAIFMDHEGRLFDFYGGLKDISDKKIRFIGNAEERIEEDFLRILRFFRFVQRFSPLNEWDSLELDDDAMNAIEKHSSKLNVISKERIFMEMKQIFSNPNNLPQVLEAMSEVGIFDVILPGDEASLDPFDRDDTRSSEFFGRDFIREANRTNSLRTDDWRFNLALFLRAWESNEAIQIAIDSFKMSNEDSEFLRKMATIGSRHSKMNINEDNFKKFVFEFGHNHVLDIIDYIVIKGNVEHIEHDLWETDVENLIEKIRLFDTPDFPVKGRDLLEKGMKPGIKLGQNLSRLKKEWIDSDFTKTKQDLLAVL